MAQLTNTIVNGDLRVTGNIYGTATKATQDGNGSTISSTYLKLSGGTMTGVLTLKANQYGDSITSSTSHALNLQNSNIIGINAIYTADAAENAAEGIHFFRDATHFDSLWMANGNIYFVPNRALGAQTSAADSEKVTRLPASISTDQVVLTNGSNGLLKTSAASSLTVGASLFPAGFSSRPSSIGWGTLKTSYTYITDWHTSAGGDVGFAESGGAVSMQINGLFYQREGANRCIDTSEVDLKSKATIMYNTSTSTIDFNFL